MKIIDTEFEGLKIIEPTVFGDDRGFFMESWNASGFAEAGLNVSFVQHNHSRSQKGVLRGMHFQSPGAQGKLVRVTAGAVFDVVVDLRGLSATFGQWFGIELSGANARMIWVPKGFAHGFLTLEDDTDFLYNCDAQYRPDTEHTLAWNDPAVGIDWPLGSTTPVLSAKDRHGVDLGSITPF